MTTLNPHTNASARRELGHPGYGWIDAQPAVQPKVATLAACDLGRTDSVISNSVQTTLVSIFEMKGAQEGLT